METYEEPIRMLKRDYDIDLIIDFLPSQQVTDYAALLETMLKVNSSEFDIYQIDVIWPGEFGDKFLDLTPHIPKELKDVHDPQIYNASNIQGRQVAVPFFADYGVLLYRTDLIEKYGFSGPPQTWDEMEKMLEVVVPAEKKLNPNFFGYVGQLNAYEGLTCNAMEWIYSNGGGTVLDQTNLSVTIDNPQAAEIISRMVSWLSPQKGYSPQASLVYDEGLSENMWFKGNTMFVRMWASMFPNVFRYNRPDFPKNKFGVPTANITRIPGRTKEESGANLGGFQLAVNKYTKNVTAAVLALRTLMTPEFQLKKAKLNGVFPTIPSVYSDPRFCEFVPHCFTLNQLKVVARPAAAASPHYLSVSQELYLRLNKILRGDVPVKEGLKDLKVALEKVTGRYVEPMPDLGPPEFVANDSALGIALQSIAGLMILLCAFMFIVILRYRTHRLLTASSPIFLMIMVFGTAIGHSSIFAFTGMPDRARCAVQPWLVVPAFSITASALIARTWRVWRVLHNYNTLVSISNRELLKYFNWLNAFNIFLLALWTMFSAPQPVLVMLKESQYWTCKSKNIQTGYLVTVILFLYNGMLLGAIAFLTSKTHKVSGLLDESRYVIKTVYAIALVNLILIPVSTIDSIGAKYQYIFKFLVVELSCLLVTCNLFAPKLIALYWHQEADMYSMSRSLRSDTQGGEEDSLPHIQKMNPADTQNMSGFQTAWSASGGPKGAGSSSSSFTQPSQRETGDFGFAIDVRSATFVDFSTSRADDEYCFECKLNSTFFQFQFGSEECCQFWMDHISGLAPPTKADVARKKKDDTTTSVTVSTKVLQGDSAVSGGAREVIRKSTIARSPGVCDRE
ncbi:hypothetical protein HDU96_008953 [Phlyctochytrium bullatum]|nr:hypothetical protein HDU96_008953 [Phlyctochytrium bullatum]